jgi:hypothetical protein
LFPSLSSSNEVHWPVYCGASHWSTPTSSSTASLTNRQHTSHKSANHPGSKSERASDDSTLPLNDISSDRLHQHIDSKRIDKTETPHSRRTARRERGKLVGFLPYLCRARITGTPHGQISGDAAGDRTGGLGLAKRKEHYLTAAPSHRFDVFNAIWHQYNALLGLG